MISAICIYGMFYFKMAQVHQLAPAAKLAYMEGMNRIVAPFLILLLVLLGICVPKRLLPVGWLNRFAALFLAAGLGIGALAGIKIGLLVVLAVSILLQVVILFLAVAGSRSLYFEKKGYWVRVGSSLIHLGLILFVFDLFLHEHTTLHVVLFWLTTVATFFGLVCCFYAESMAGFLKGGNDADRHQAS